MNLRLISATVILLSVCQLVSGQSFKQQFAACEAKKDTNCQKRILTDWEKSNAEDPELFVAAFNYYIKTAKNEYLRLDEDGQGQDGFALMAPDSSKKEPVAYLYGDSEYDPVKVAQGMAYVDRGIELHPNRLDLRFGKIYVLGLLEDYDAFTAEIIRVVEYSGLNKNAWTWSEGKALEKAKDFMLDAVQDYQMMLYETNDDGQLKNMQRIAEAVLKLYPDHVQSLSDLAITYLLLGEFDTALKPLKQAEKLDPKDFIVLNNIAMAYRYKGDNKNAIKYYKKTLKYGDAQAKKQAQHYIDELEKEK